MESSRLEPQGDGNATPGTMETKLDDGAGIYDRTLHQSTAYLKAWLRISFGESQNLRYFLRELTGTVTESLVLSEQ